MSLLDSQPVRLVLEDGRSFDGWRFGGAGDAGGEVVFNTSMTGYQEILTDPSYAGQIVVMSYPMIGNYGMTGLDAESARIHAAALVVKEPSRIASSWRQQESLDAALLRSGVPGLFGIDTRALVHHLRERGAMRGVICATDIARDAARQRACDVPSMVGLDLARSVTTSETYGWSEGLQPLAKTTSPSGDNLHVVVYDFGVKHGILRQLVSAGCKVTVVPASTLAADVVALAADGVLLSNGPGDPEPVTYAVEQIKQLIGVVPIFGICLGHQLLALAAGAASYKLPFGHRGGNHPVKDLRSGRVAVTSHNHGFSIAAESLAPERATITHIDLNDGTVEGIALRDAPAFSVQYHPEAAPGPHDANDLFAEFVEMMRAHKKSEAR